MADLFEAAGLDQGAPRPLADRLRPQKLAEVVGQEHLLKADGPIGRMVAQKRLASMVLWGPPGVGKTTIARLLAEETGLEFQQISAVFSGVADLRKVFDTARGRRASGKGTLLFVDEIHRFNRAQQDSFLPVMEDGTVILVGATTENPLFAVNSALVSRSTLFRLEPASYSALEMRGNAAVSTATGGTPGFVFDMPDNTASLVLPRFTLPEKGDLLVHVAIEAGIEGEMLVLPIVRGSTEARRRNVVRRGDELERRDLSLVSVGVDHVWRGYGSIGRGDDDGEPRVRHELRRRLHVERRHVPDVPGGAHHVPLGEGQDRQRHRDDPARAV